MDFIILMKQSLVTAMIIKKKEINLKNINDSQLYHKYKFNLELISN